MNSWSIDVLVVTRINEPAPFYLVNGIRVMFDVLPQCVACETQYCDHCRAVSLAIQLTESTEEDTYDLPF